MHTAFFCRVSPLLPLSRVSCLLIARRGRQPCLCQRFWAFLLTLLACPLHFSLFSPLLHTCAAQKQERGKERESEKGAETFLKRFQLYGPLISPVSLRLPLRLSISRIVVSQMLENAFPPAFPPSLPSRCCHTLPNEM